MRPIILPLVLLLGFLVSCSRENEDTTNPPSLTQLMSWDGQRPKPDYCDDPTLTPLKIIEDLERKEGEINEQLGKTGNEWEDIKRERLRTRLKDQLFWHSNFNRGCTDPLEYLFQIKENGFFLSEDASGMADHIQVVSQVLEKHTRPLLDEAGDCQGNCAVVETQNYIQNFIDDVYEKNFSEKLWHLRMGYSVNAVNARNGPYWILDFDPGTQCVITQISINQRDGEDLKKIVIDYGSVTDNMINVAPDVSSVVVYELEGCEVAESHDTAEIATEAVVALPVDYDNFEIEVTVPSVGVFNVKCENQGPLSGSSDSSFHFRPLCGQTVRL